MLINDIRERREESTRDSKSINTFDLLDGVVVSINAQNRTAAVRIFGEDQARQKPMKYPNYINQTPAVGDKVKVCKTSGVYAVLAFY